MSAGSRIIIAAITLVCAAGFFLTAVDINASVANPLLFYGLAVCCSLIAIAALFPNRHSFTVRALGTMFCCGYIAQLSTEPQSLLTPFLSTLCLGLPASYLAVTGRISPRR